MSWSDKHFLSLFTVTTKYNVHFWAKKTAPLYFCTNLVKTYYSEMIIGRLRI